MEQNIKDQEKSADENGFVCNGRLISLIIRGNYIYILETAFTYNRCCLWLGPFSSFLLLGLWTYFKV